MDAKKMNKNNNNQRINRQNTVRNKSHTLPQGSQHAWVILPGSMPHQRLQPAPTNSKTKDEQRTKKLITLISHKKMISNQFQDHKFKFNFIYPALVEIKKTIKQEGILGTSS